MTFTVEEKLPSFDQLPSALAVQLTELSAISLSGEEQNKYLQGQVTCDVHSANENSLLNGAHCDAKGKVFSAFRFIMRNGDNLLVQPKSTLDASLAELKKFGVFAKVEIEEAKNLSFIAVCGAEATQALSSNFSVLPTHISPVEQVNNTTLVFIDGAIPRYLIIDTPEQINAYLASLNIAVYPQSVWNLLEITEGFPALQNDGVSSYVPQMLNLQAVNAISFTKGCYLGQETVARMQYLGKNKRALFSIAGTTNDTIESPVIEKQLGDNWRKAGDVLTSYQAEDGSVYFQAVLSSDTEQSATLRLQDSNTQLTIQPLPYSLTEKE